MSKSIWFSKSNWCYYLERIKISVACNASVIKTISITKVISEKGDKFCQVEWKSHIFTTVFTTYYGKRTYLDKGKIFNCKDRWVRKIFSIWIVKFFNPWFLTIYFKIHCQESCVCILLSIKFIRSATYFMAKLTHHLTCYFYFILNPLR